MQNIEIQFLHGFFCVPSHELSQTCVHVLQLTGSKIWEPFVCDLLLYVPILYVVRALVVHSTHCTASTGMGLDGLINGWIIV